MTTIRVATRERYTTIDRRTVNDSRLSFKARGILVWLLDKPDEWVTSTERIEQQGKEGREAVRSALKELEEFGYLVRTRWRDSNGRWQREWRIYESPDRTMDGNPSTVSRRRKTVSGNPSHIEKTEKETEIAQMRFLRPDERHSCDQCVDGWIEEDNVVSRCPSG